jgi:hypothetical protein
MSIESIDKQGNLTFSFSKDINIPADTETLFKNTKDDFMSIKVIID